MVWLIDMDDVLADYNGSMHQRWAERHPDKPQIALEDRTDFLIFREEQLLPYKDELRAIRAEKDFIYSLKPMPGALEAMTEIMHLQIDAFICTSPLIDYQNCVGEKYEWAHHHLGRYWVEKLILTKDKTVVKADILIDDNPEINGVMEPTWEHIVFDQPYNRNVTDKRRMTWANWREVLNV